MALGGIQRNLCTLGTDLCTIMHQAKMSFLSQIFFTEPFLEPLNSSFFVIDNPLSHTEPSFLSFVFIHKFSLLFLFLLMNCFPALIHKAADFQSTEHPQLQLTEMESASVQYLYKSSSSSLKLGT